MCLASVHHALLKRVLWHHALLVVNSLASSRLPHYSILTIRGVVSSPARRVAAAATSAAAVRLGTAGDGRGRGGTPGGRGDAGELRNSYFCRVRTEFTNSRSHHGQGSRLAPAAPCILSTGTRVARPASVRTARLLGRQPLFLSQTSQGLAPPPRFLSLTSRTSQPCATNE